MLTRDTVPPELLADVKNYLNITWGDASTDALVCGYIAAASAYLDGKIGGGPDYAKDGLPRTLLMEHCRYQRDSALDVFENNYRALILGAQNERLEVAQDGVVETV